MSPITELKLWLKLQPIINNEEKLMKMKLTTSTVCQIILGVIDVLNIVTPLTQGSVKLDVAAAAGILHIVVNTIAHISNPDGTSYKVGEAPKQ